MKTLKTLTQTEINGIIDYLSHSLRHWKPDIIIAIAKGGLIPARLIARRLSVSKILSFGISFYDNNDVKMDSPIIYQSLNDCKHLLTPDTKILIVDDIADTGESIVACVNHLYKDLGIPGTNVKTCCMFYKPQSYVIPGYYFDAVDPETWVTFVWE